MKGLIMALTGAWLSGLSIPGIKLFLDDVSPFQLIFISNLGAIVFIVIAKAFISPGWNFPKPKEWKWLIAGLIIGSGFAVPLAILGMVTVSGTVSGLLFNLETFFTFYIAYYLFKERLGPKAHMAMVCVFFGGLVAAMGGGPIKGSGQGMVYIMLSCLLFGIQTNIFKKVESMDSFSMASVEFFCTWLVSFVISRSLNHSFPETPMILLLLTLGIMTYAMGNVLFFHCLKKIGAGRTATIFGASPLLGAVSSLFILGEPVTWPIISGFILVTIGLILLVWEKKKKHGPPMEESTEQPI